MGEGAYEAMQNGLSEEYEPRKRYRSSKYNNEIWEDITGKNRHITDMHSLHLCFIINYVLTWKKEEVLLMNRLYLMRDVLKCRDFNLERLNTAIFLCKTNCLVMYEKEDMQVEKYYGNLLRKYPDYNWSNLISFMGW